jgi:hypothetical protein
MSGEASPVWGCAIEGEPAPMLKIALGAVCRNGSAPKTLAACNGEPWRWVRQVAECLKTGQCRVAILFCQDAGLACCIANKVPGVRAAAVGSIAQAHQALDQLGANLLVVEMAGRTYYEFKELLRLCHAGTAAVCPPGVACVLEELDGHAHR